MKRVKLRKKMTVKEFRKAATQELARRKKADEQRDREHELCDRMAAVVAKMVDARLEPLQRARDIHNHHDSWFHGAKAAVDALMVAGAIIPEYEPFIRERLGNRTTWPVVQIKGVPILPPDYPDPRAVSRIKKVGEG